MCTKKVNLYLQLIKCHTSNIHPSLDVNRYSYCVHCGCWNQDNILSTPCSEGQS